MGKLTFKAGELTKEAARDMYIKWAESCRKDGVGLTEWEKEYIDSILHQMGNGSFLSPKQINILENIYAEKTP